MKSTEGKASTRLRKLPYGKEDREEDKISKQKGFAFSEKTHIF